MGEIRTFQVLLTYDLERIRVLIEELGAVDDEPTFVHKANRLTNEIEVLERDVGHYIRFLSGSINDGIDMPF